MSLRDRIEAQTETLVQELIKGSDLEMVDVEFVKERDYYLRVYIDKEGGIEIDDCEALSTELEKKLDEEDFIPESYILEVSSPGIDRVLRKERDLVREEGKSVDVTLYAPLETGEKLVTGVLTGHTEKSITLDSEREIPLEKVAQVRLHIDF